MRKKTIVIGTLAVVAVAGWYTFRPERLFLNKTVNETLTAATPAGATGDVAAATTPSVPTLPTLAAGRFHSNAHETSGNAAVFDLGQGRRVLRLTEFATSNGPDLRVYLVAADDVNDNATVKAAGFVELGSMKGNRGDQNYDIPKTVDLAKYRTVTIWCRRFSVNFGSAPLIPS